MKLLIEAGADANPRLRYGTQWTPLQLSAEKGIIEIINTLLDEDADINTPPFDKYGVTALQFAVIGGYVGVTQLLIQRGADIVASPAKIGRRTALVGAAEHGRIDMVQLFLNSGALITAAGLAHSRRARSAKFGVGEWSSCSSQSS